VLLMAAAPADFRAAAPESEKLAREAAAGLELRLEPTEDVLAAAARTRGPDQILVGFAAESGDSVERARAKLERKGVDAIVFNDVSRPEIGFDSTSNEVTIVERGGEHHVPMASKDDVANAILDRVETLRSKQAAGSRQKR
jgi:phosphopantothenoylcysteine decarboxylase/phosphopantothenate--cysteine ligase